MAQLGPDGRDLARRRIGATTASVAIIAAGVAGAGTILAWRTSSPASAGTGTSSQVWGHEAAEHEDGEHEDGEHEDGDGGHDDGGGGWSGVSGGVDLPPGGIAPAQPPGQGSGGGVVGSQGS